MNKDKLIENNKPMTVSDIAKAAGVSRNVVWHYIKKNNIKPEQKDTKPFLFNADLVFEVVSKHNETQTKTQHQTQKRTQTQKQEKSYNINDTTVSADVLEILKTQIENLNKQIEFKDKQLENQRKDINYFQQQLVDTRLELKNKQQLLDSTQSHQQTNAEESDRLKQDLADAKKEIESLKEEAETNAELQEIVDNVENATLWQRITKRFY